MEKKGMTNKQYEGIIKMIIKMLQEDEPKEKIIEYLKTLIKE